MPSPNDQTEYIEVTDFSPGIFSDFHSSVSPRFTAADTQAGALIGVNGIARAAGTSRCRADKTGALVPLPKPQATGIRDTIAPSAIDAFRPYRYVLDAQVGPILSDGSEVEIGAFQTPRQTVQVMWGHYSGPDLSGAHKPIVVGREYRPWVLFPPSAGQQHAAIVDFVVAAAVGSDPDSLTEARLPIGQLARARFYYGFTAGAFNSADAFTVNTATDVFTGEQPFQNDEAITFPTIVTSTGFAINTTYYVRDTGIAGLNTFKIAATQGGAAIDITGANGSGTVSRVLDRAYRPLWMYPVSVCMIAPPWARWGAGNRLMHGAITPADQTLYGFANQSEVVGIPHAYWSPAIGLNGQGTCLLAMQLFDDGTLNLPFPGSGTSLANYFWYHHFSERGNVPQNSKLWDIAGGPINPYILVSHQGRIVFPDRRRTPPAWLPGDAQFTFGYIDDLLFYSGIHTPMQNFALTPLVTDRGVTNQQYASWNGVSIWPIATHERYNTLLAAEDVVADVGTVGVVTVDQLLIVKHSGGGAMIAGDLDNPQIHRLPYIESTGGVICKGASTPLGFVYGSRNGIFLFGGDNTDRLSPQLDGFFWDHSDGSEHELYAGSRGRMGYWNGLICVPNNYVYDIETKSWWRLAVPTLSPVSPGVAAPFNCYDTDNDNNLLYAFPYRHSAVPHESHILFPANPTQQNVLHTPDFLGAGTQRDVRFVIDRVTASTGTIRSICGQWAESGDQRSWRVRLDATDHLQFQTSTDGTAGTVITATCDDVLSGEPIAVKISWSSARAAGQQVVFEWKAAAGPAEPLLKDDAGWLQMGTAEAGAAAALFNSTAAFTIGNRSNTGLAEPIGNQRVFAVTVATTIDDPPLFGLYPRDIPTNEAATTFNTSTGHTMTVVRAGAGPQLVLDNVNQADTPPVWYTFDPDILDSTYTWQSHPLIETRLDRTTSFQNITIVATGRSTVGTAPSVVVDLEGFNEKGEPVAARSMIFGLALTTEPQKLRGDVRSAAGTNFNAAYVTMKLTVTDPNGNPAPKIHRVSIGIGPSSTRARIPRHGQS